MPKFKSKHTALKQLLRTPDKLNPAPMIKILTILLLIVCVINIPKRPMIPIFGYYFNAILVPKTIWFWAFDGIPVSFILTLSTLASCAIVLVREPNRLHRLIREPQNIGMLSLWLLIHIANIFANYSSTSIGVSSRLVLETLNTLMIVYFASAICIKTEKDFQFLSFAILLPVAYYTYWANWSYLSGDIWRHATTGRLRGPTGSIYQDENSFAVLFVVGIPYIFFFALSQKKFFYRWAIMGLLPAVWHAIFLCGSRGGLIGTAVTTIACVLYARNKTISVLVISMLVIATITQGGNLLNRAQNTIQSDDAPIDKPIDPRILSWTAGARMIIDHPILGVGTERFQAAYPNYQEGSIHVAHNTFFQIASNNGLPAGIIYILFFYGAWRFHQKKMNNNILNPSISHLNNAVICSMIGFFVCSMFLDLLIYEVFYFLLLMAFAKKITSINTPPPKKSLNI